MIDSTQSNHLLKPTPVNVVHYTRDDNPSINKNFKINFLEICCFYVNLITERSMAHLNDCWALKLTNF